MTYSFAAHLAQHGPQVWADRRATREEGLDYCRRLAESHDENFTVVSWLLPKAVRPHFYNVYAFCRWADDLGDEAPAAERLPLLAWWESELRACYAGDARHPVFVALRDTIDQHPIPIEPWLDLLSAFRQDQTQTRYATFEELADYCRRSADPVGRVLLYLAQAATPGNFELSDAICTGLQLTNFLQDVAVDWDRGRVYLPQATLDRFGYDEGRFARREADDAFRSAMDFEVDRAEGWLRRGLPLVESTPRWLRFDVELFAQGGLAVLQRIRGVEFDVWRRRPRLSKWDKLAVAGRALWSHALCAWPRRGRVRR